MNIRRLICIILLSCIALNGSPSAQAEPAYAWEYADHYSTNLTHVWDLVIINNTGYIGDKERGLLIFDFSNPIKPIELGSIELEGLKRKIIINDDIAYILHTKQFSIINVSNSAEPKMIGNYSFPRTPDAIAISGSRAFIADRWAGLFILDISNLSEPYEIGSIDTLGYARDVAVVGNYAYVADGYEGLRIYNVSDPQNITEVDSQFTTVNRIITVVDEYIYTCDNYFAILNVTDPKNPTKVGSSTTAYCGIDMEIIDDLAFITHIDSIQLIDISDKTNPVVIDEIDFYELFRQFGIPFISDLGYYCISATEKYAYMSVDDSDLPKNILIFERQLDSDRDGTGDGVDVYPDDPAASYDYDGDGYPDIWNPGQSQVNSTMGLQLDAFPGNPAASVDTDGDGYPDRWNEGQSRDNSVNSLHIDAFPNDPAASFDSDGDGYPDCWNEGYSAEDSTTGLEIDHHPYNARLHSDLHMAEICSSIFLLIVVGIVFLLRKHKLK